MWGPQGLRRHSFADVSVNTSNTIAERLSTRPLSGSDALSKAVSRGNSHSGAGRAFARAPANGPEGTVVPEKRSRLLQREEKRRGGQFLADPEGSDSAKRTFRTIDHQADVQVAESSAGG